MTDAELVRAAVRASGLSSSAFARDVLEVDPRTVRRWKAGGQNLSKRCRRICLETLLDLEKSG